ncbi:hypothetical protein DNHGIG_04640 [Collibacillus ludicampi]|jgi:hypothetical protein|uniref:Uncharacterized protein n=1 Tax=Collibacillus ludicampi TaxID=2771369 RepID=A0AAV4LAU4_9BACL|nr:hypothetical protein [Collibacillus ludicampi]GIM44915.1 hypothetical protein DNHGIG_04640 [Collibacillus ludicampi]
MSKFMPVKSLTGELKRTEIRRGTAYKLTTNEFVLQREDTAYVIDLNKILGVIACDPSETSTHTDLIGDTHVSTHFGQSSYKIIATEMLIFTRHGVSERGASTLHTSLSDDFTRLLINHLHAQKPF